MESLEEKVARLERQNKLLAMALIGPLFLAVVALFKSPDPANVPDEIRAKSFIVVNDEGAKLAELCPDEHGSGSLGLLNDAGKYIILADSTPNKCGALNVADASGRRRYMTAIAQDGRIYTGYYGNKGMPLLYQGQELGGWGFVAVRNTRGKISASMTSSNSGYGLMVLASDKGERRIDLFGGLSDGSCGIILRRDATEKVGALRITAGPRQLVGVSCYDKKGAPRLFSGMTKPDEARINFMAQSGKSLLLLAGLRGKWGGIVTFDANEETEAAWPYSFARRWGKE